MEPLMNAPQWFLEREDSVELIGLLKNTYYDPVQELNRLMDETEKKYLVLYESPDKVYIRIYYSTTDIESDLADIMKREFIRIRCAYDIQNDQYIPISVCLVVGRQND